MESKYQFVFDSIEDVSKALAEKYKQDGICKDNDSLVRYLNAKCIALEAGLLEIKKLIEQDNK